MKKAHRTSSMAISVLAALLLAVSMAACGSESEKSVSGEGDRAEAVSEGSIEELNDVERRAVGEAYAQEAEEQIDAENAEAELEKLAKEIEADL